MLCALGVAVRFAHPCSEGVLSMALLIVLDEQPIFSASFD